jgi:rubrerythrin
MPRKKKQEKDTTWQDVTKRVWARIIGKEYINVWECRICHTKWDRVEDKEYSWIMCPRCQRSGIAFLKKREKLG